jgi:hypothetical protein
MEAIVYSSRSTWRGESRSSRTGRAGTGVGVYPMARTAPTVSVRVGAIGATLAEPVAVGLATLATTDAPAGDATTFNPEGSGPWS